MIPRAPRLVAILAVAAAAGFAGAACVPLRGGWDAEGLLAATPELAAIRGHRIGELTPHPAPDGERLRLVACRFADGAAIRVTGAGPGWPVDWAERAVVALDAALPAVALSTVAPRASGAGVSSSGEPAIRADSIEDPDAKGPAGLGDTLVRCDVSRTVSGAIRGILVDAEIRMRRRQRHWAGGVVVADREAWTAAFLHELGHALGFAGHVALGPSLVTRDQVELRTLARRALAAEPLVAPNVEALYALAPGRVLGEARIAPEARERWRAVLDEVAAFEQARGPATAILSQVGDRAARLEWRWADGERVAVRWPRWQAELAAGQPVGFFREPRRRSVAERADGRGEASATR